MRFTILLRLNRRAVLSTFHRGSKAPLHLSCTLLERHCLGDTPMDDDDLGIFEFLAHSTQARIAHYRHRAADIRARAEAVSGARRVELLKLAEEFEELAGRITMNRRA